MDAKTNLYFHKKFFFRFYHADSHDKDFNLYNNEARHTADPNQTVQSCQNMVARNIHSRVKSYTYLKVPIKLGFN